jgi:hypothetical protein
VRVTFCENPKYILGKVQIGTQLYASVGENNVECRVKPKAMGLALVEYGLHKMEPSKSPTPLKPMTKSFIECKD